MSLLVSLDIDTHVTIKLITGYPRAFCW